MYITDDTYTKKQVLRMEHLVLKVLNFDLAIPSALTFANLFSKMSESEERTAHLAQYLCELTLMDGETYLGRFLLSRTCFLSISLSLSVYKVSHSARRPCVGVGVTWLHHLAKLPSRF